MKRFNTDRIRQRMREHNERFPNSKAKLLSSAPVRISLPPQTDKENFVPSTSNANSLNGQDEAYSESIKTESLPQVSISVTMSEADDHDECDTAGTTENEFTRVSDDEDNNTVPSVWAMMENYQGASKDGSRDEYLLSKNPVRIVENDSYENSYHHSLAELSGLNTTAADFHLHKVFGSGVKSKRIAAMNDDTKADGVIRIPTGIHWSEDEEGELIQSSFYTLEASEIGNNEEAQTLENDATHLSSVNENDKTAIFRRDAASCVSDQAVSSTCDLRSNGRESHLTGTRVRKERVDSGNDEDFSTHPDSLMQESMIHSVQASCDGDSLAVANTPSNNSNYQTYNDSKRKFSFSSVAESKSTSEFEATTSAATTAATAQAVTKPKLHVQTQELNNVYFDRLGELESNLKVQQNNTDQLQSRLKERVMELEQALKVTVATPRGTVVDENPLKTLLNRNQTLVKEVRFADQTCVELSSKISELEMRNERLQDQVVVLEQENSNIQSERHVKEDGSSRMLLEKEAMIEKLEKELSLANESLRTKTIEEENLRLVMCQALTDLNFIDEAPGLSLASSIISERDNVTQDHSMDSNSNQVSKTIQQQIGVLVEKAKSSLHTEKMKKEINELRSENIALKSELLVDQLRINTDRVPTGNPSESTKEILQVRKENEFLGRQLGIVQEKLDRTQKNLIDEYLKSESLKVQLERGLEIYEQLIEPLERRLIQVAEFNPQLHDLADADKRLFGFEKELIHVKATIAALKHESERLLTAPTIDLDVTSDKDQHQKIVSMVQATISRLGHNYKQLELDVERMTGGFSERLDGLTATISHLRSSLLFEKESVASVLSNRKEGEEKMESSSVDRQNCGSSVDLINATIPVVGEARSPRKQEISISSELDDISRLLNDDMTLESIIKSVSISTSISNMDTFKESLEAAVSECKRVKERSIKLKDQIESQKTKIEKIEQENGKLCLDASRRSEEFRLMETALEEAKEEIEVLRSTSIASQSGKKDLHEQFEDEKKEGKVSEEENERLKRSIAEVQKEKKALEVQINEYEILLVENKTKLESAMQSSDKYKKEFHELHSHFSTKMQHVSEQKDLESAETRRALQVTLNEKSELKRFHQDALKRLSQEVDSKLKLESLINELQHSKLQAQSDLEDRDLESKFACEDMRKERAELKYRLAQSEKELLSLKESYINFKDKMEEKRGRMERNEIQWSDLLAKISLMTEKRVSFVNLLENFECCKDLAHNMTTKDYKADTSSPFESMIREIDCWKCAIPLIGDKIEAFHHTLKRVPKLEAEIEKLSNNLSKHEIRESDQIKQAEDQTSQNEKLFLLLRQAEEEMERSTIQIKEMSEAMVLMQQRENEANLNIKLMDSELVKLKNESKTCEFEKNEELTKMKNLLLDTSATLEKKESQILEMNSQMNSMRSEIDGVTSLLRSKESEEDSLKVNIQAYEKKNSRLREYIRKLTTKCEEWETSYDRQSRVIDRLQEKKARVKEKAYDIAGRYRALVADINRRKRLHQHDREKWSHERSHLNSVHAALEQELEQIAKELA